MGRAGFAIISLLGFNARAGAGVAKLVQRDDGYCNAACLSVSLKFTLQLRYHHYDDKNFVRFIPASLRHPCGASVEAHN